MTEREELRYDGEPGRRIRLAIDRPANADGPRPSARPAVIVVHGFKGFMDWGFFPGLARRLTEAGFVSVRFNMSGSGVGEDLETFSDEEGFARNTYSRELEDLGRVRERVDALPGVDPRRLAILGHSLGGGIALLHAAERGDYRAVVGWASVSTVVRFDAETRERWRREGALWVHNGRTGQDHRLDPCWLKDAEQNTDRLDVLAAARRLASPTLLVHGTADEAVPFAEGRALADALGSRGRLLALEGAGHTFGAVHPMPDRGPPPDLARALEATLEHLSDPSGG